MEHCDSGWDWFEGVRTANKLEDSPAQIDADLLRAYARFSNSEDGYRILRHLRAITLDRSLGPNVSEATLRHLEGQRQLFNYIGVLAERGGGLSQVRDISVTPFNQRGRETENDK